MAKKKTSKTDFNAKTKTSKPAAPKAVAPKKPAASCNCRGCGSLGQI
jgi:hypothetical protein